MYQSLRKCRRLRKTSLSYVSNLIDHCLYSKSLFFAKSVHAHLIKLGLNHHTFQGNHCVDIYSKFGTTEDALQAFRDIYSKNVVSWNIGLKVFVQSCDLDRAHQMFDEMPERDVVSWNCMISGYASNGLSDCAFELFGKMQADGIWPSGFTFSILVLHVNCGRRGKEIHGNMIRNGVNLSNVVVGNSLIDMYGKLGLVDYAFGVFLIMETVDIITWNSLLSGCCKSGYEDLALNYFYMMIDTFSPDEYTISTVLAACSNLQDIEKGKQVLSLCIKLGFLSNTIVSSAMIDLFSKCNRVEDAIYIFEYIDARDSALCNSMISCYARNCFEDNALQLFVLTLRKDIRPTEFTLSCAVNCALVFLHVEQGTQLHCLVDKLGFESDSVVASSLVDMYSKYGLIDSAMFIFGKMDVRDLIAWNTMILGLTYNGKTIESLDLFKEMLERGPPPDHITLTGVLLACNYGGFVNEGTSIFASMAMEYGIVPMDEHYACIVDLMSRAGKLEEALNILETMPYEPKALFWKSLLNVSELYGDLKLMEKVAERISHLEPHSSVPYLALAKEYERRGRWESLVRVKKVTEERTASERDGCSWIGIGIRVYLFRESQLQHHCGKDIYSMLRMMIVENIEKDEDIVN